MVATGHIMISKATILVWADGKNEDQESVLDPPMPACFLVGWAKSRTTQELNIRWNFSSWHQAGPVTCAGCQSVWDGAKS